MMKSDKRITNYLSVIVLMLLLSIQLSAQSGDCATDYTLNFTDAGNDWHVNDVSGSYTVGAQTFDIAIDDADHILESTNESNEGLEVRIDPHDRDDVLTITYTLSETANSVSFPIVDLDKKSGGSDQQEQVCVTGYLGNNPIAIMPMITSLDGHVDISGNCATATTNSATSGQDESVLVEFNQCIDRVVIEYGSGPMVPHDPTASKIYIGEGSGFTANVCNACDENCTSENVLDFTESGQNWIDATIGGIYTAGTQTYTINLVDDDGILETNAEDGPFSEESHEGIKIGINPHSNDDKVTACYALSEVSNKVYFKIRDLDKKSSGASNQQEQVCIYATLGDDPTIISPILTSLDGSVMISETADGVGCATGTTNSSTSHQEESVLVEFDECIDKIFIVYGSGPMAPDNPTYSHIFIGEEFGFYTGVCGEGCTTATCEANAGTLTLNNDSGDICFTGGDGQVSATPDGNVNVPAGYEVLYVLTSGSDLVIEEVASNPVFVIEESGDYTIHTLVYDSNTLDLNSIELGVTTGIEVNSLLIQGGGDICASLDVVGAPFSADLPRAGILTADVTAFCSDGSGSTDISASPAGVVSVPDGYEILYVLTSGSGLVIEGVSDTPAFTVDGMGRYTIHTLVYDPATLDLSGIELGVTTGFDVSDALTQGGGDICGALDVTGAVFNIQDVSAGTLSLSGDDNVCIVDGGDVSATPNGDAIIPAGYQVGFVLTQGADLVIIDVDNAPSFDIDESGAYTIHSLVYDPTTLDLNDIELGVTTGLDVNSLLVQGGGDICASLDVGGARFTAEVLNTGDLTPVGASNLCFDSSGIMLTAMADGEAIIPAGYDITYVLTSGDGLVIEAVSDTPEFMVDGTGLYTIHTLVYDPTTLDLNDVELGVTTGFDVNAALAQGGGEVCGALDVAGASFVIDNPDAGGISAGITGPICSNFGVIPLEGIPDGNAVVPTGYNLIYVLTSGADLVIQEVNTVLPQFNVSDNGIYTIHTLVFNPATLDLSGVEFGVTTGGDINSLLVQGGGDVCADLDVTGASFELVTCVRDNDLDDDGISNIQEGNGVDPSADDDNDGIANYEDPDYPGFEDINSDGINDRFDQDLDGIADIFDLDSDNDGIADIIEAGGSDENGDGLVDEFVDADGDGWTDIYDTDDDTTPELNDASGTALPHNDSDGDGLPNSVDLDSDSDGVADIVEAGGIDVNGDGYIDDTTDSDGDGYADMVDTDNNTIEGPNDGGTALPSPDSDNDGSVDALDLDSDNDGLSDLSEAGGKDLDGNGQLDMILDADGDGLANLVDTDNNNIEGPDDGGTALPSPDLDGDGIINRIDLDSDNDGLSDLSESIGDIAIIMAIDSNGMGTISGMDMDKDGIIDGIFDDDMDLFGGSLTIAMDSDGDLIPNHLDIDSDGDGIVDITEGQPTLSFVIPLGGENADIDGDGINDAFDSNKDARGGFDISAVDTDNDGVPDYLDLDSDDDNEPDAIEGFDFNGDGEPELPLSGMPGDPDNDGLDGIYDEVVDAFDQTNNETYATELADADGGTLERDFRSVFSINIIVYLSGALIDLNNNGYLNTMRSDLNDRGLLPGQDLIGLGTPTPAGQPYNREPWNYMGAEGTDWTNRQYDQIAEFTGSEVVDWVLVSFRRDFTADSRIARFAGLVLEDGRVVFTQDIDLAGEEQLYILVEHRNHMAAMTPEPVMVNAGRIFYDFTLSDGYIGPDPANPLGAGQLQVIPGIFALYNSDGEQVVDATQAQNPSYNITGADKTVWQPQNGTFNIYQAADYNMNGDTNGADIIPFSFFSGVFSVVPR